MKTFNIAYTAPATLFLLAATAFAQPQIAPGGVVNGATYVSPGLPNSGIAQGSIFTIFGTNLGPDVAETGFSYPLPTVTPVGKVSVNITVNGVLTQAIFLFAGKGQINAILPSSTPVGTGAVTVSVNGQSSAPEPIQVVTSNFGSFSQNSSGTGPGIVTYADYSLVSAAKAANPGETLVLWGTGIGPVKGVENAGPLPGDQTGVLTQVFVGNAPATVTYRGRSGCCAGLDQIGFVIPANIEGCSVPVAVQIGDLVSNFTTIAVAKTGRACTADSTGLTTSNFTNLAGKPDASFGSIFLTRSTTTTPALPGTPDATTTTDSGMAIFEKVSIPSGTLYSPAQFETVSFGACTVTTFSSKSRTTTPAFPLGGKLTGLDAGQSLTVTGPAGTRALTGSSLLGLGYYSNFSMGDGTPGNFFDPGRYSVTGTGGADIGAFSASLILPQALTWTNQSSIDTVNRAAGQLVTWSGGDSTSNVSINGESTSISNGTDFVGSAFHCQARVSDGSFTIPSVVLLSLPVSTNTAISGFSVPGGSLSLGAATTYSTFTAPGLDLGLVYASSVTSKSVTYQ